MNRKLACLQRAAAALSLLVLGSFPLTVRSEILKEEEITFTAEDLQTGYGKKPWIATRPEETTKVWGLQNAAQAPEVGDGRLRIGDTNLVNSAIVWKIAVPETLRVKSFTWAADTVILVGAAGAEVTFRWEYSVDEENWTPLFSIENRPSNADTSSPMYIHGGVYTATFDKEQPRIFYIRAVNEGTVAEGDSTYYAIWSNFPNGGEGEKSYISVDVANP